jgi:hypothetical protein
MAGNVKFEGTPCIGRARDRNGGRVGRSGTKEDIESRVEVRKQNRQEKMRLHGETLSGRLYGRK